MGNDCLGSVRIPASYNGIIGLRPTYERIDTTGETPYCESLDVLGFVAKETIIFQNNAEVLLKDDQKEFKFKRLIIATDCFNTIDEEVRVHFNKAINFIKKYFEVIIEIDIAPEGLNQWVETFQKVQGFEDWESYGGCVNKYRPKLSPGPISRLKQASKITICDYNNGKKEMKKVEKQIK